jgi:hypothetical protein
MRDPKEEKMRQLLVVLGMAACSITSAMAQVRVDIGIPGISIGFNVPVYPQLVAVPGFPVYYAPRLGSNYFFYDGMYWVYARDNWYASSWYNGPWGIVVPDAVPPYVLRVPVRYYRQPPVYFGRWQPDAPPRWGEHWGSTWERSHSGWNNWNRTSVPAPAPLPVYQRQYSGAHYPKADRQHALQGQTPAPQQAAPPRSQKPSSGAAYQRPGPGETSAPPGRSAQHPAAQRSQEFTRDEHHAPRSPSQDEGSQGRESGQERSHGQKSGERQER